MKEIWKFYKENSCHRLGKRVYEVSNFGRVKCNGKLYKCGIGKNGYYYLCREYLHRIVAKLFIPNPDNKPCVDHINTNKLDNRVSNLRWCTHKENNNNLLTIQHSRQGKPSKSVLQYTKDNIFVAEYISIQEAYRQTNIFNGSIRKCCKNKLKSAGGYIWRYKKEDLI